MNKSDKEAQEAERDKAPQALATLIQHELLRPVATPSGGIVIDGKLDDTALALIIPVIPAIDENGAVRDVRVLKYSLWRHFKALGLNPRYNAVAFRNRGEFTFTEPGVLFSVCERYGIDTAKLKAAVDALKAKSAEVPPVHPLVSTQGGGTGLV